MKGALYPQFDMLNVQYTILNKSAFIRCATQKAAAAAFDRMRQWASLGSGWRPSRQRVASLTDQPNAHSNSARYPCQPCRRKARPTAAFSATAAATLEESVAVSKTQRRASAASPP